MLMFSPLISQPDALGSGDSTRTLTVGDLKRTYIDHIPKFYDGSNATPRVLVFHRGGSNLPAKSTAQVVVGGSPAHLACSPAQASCASDYTPETLKKRRFSTHLRTAKGETA